MQGVVIVPDVLMSTEVDGLESIDPVFIDPGYNKI